MGNITKAIFRIFSYRWSPWAIIGLFGLMYCLTSFVNHYLFRTAAYDLGIFNNAIYNYSRLHWDISMVRIGSGPGMLPKNLLADHFELYPMIFAPFRFLFGSYTLLIFQVGSVLAGGYGMYKLILLKTNDDFLARASMFHFYAIWGIFTALAFDYHNNVVAAMGVPWFFYFFFKRNWTLATIACVFVVFGKENMAIWMSAIGLGLALGNFKDKEYLKRGLFYCILSFLLFVLIIKVFIPEFANPGEAYAYNTFKSLGNNLEEVFKNILLHPLLTFKLLFINHLGIPDGNGVKMFTHIVILLSGGWALFFRPQYLVMLLPIYFQKMLYDEPGRWSCYYQYSIEFAPILTLALFSVIFYYFKDRKLQKISFTVAFILVTILTSMFVLNVRHNWTYEGCVQRFYTKRHYKQPFKISDAEEAMALIPSNASVTAQCLLVPRLAFRDTIYQYPYGKGAQYILVIKGELPYRVMPKTFDSLRTEYSDTSKGYISFYKDSVLLIQNRLRYPGPFKSL